MASFSRARSAYALGIEPSAEIATAIAHHAARDLQEGRAVTAMGRKLEPSTGYAAVGLALDIVAGEEFVVRRGN